MKKKISSASIQTGEGSARVERPAKQVLANLGAMPAKETQIKSKTVVRYISRSPRVPCVARCIEGCERDN